MRIVLEPIRNGDEERFRALAGESHVTHFLPDMKMTATYAAQLAEQSRAFRMVSPREQMRLFGIYREDLLVGGLTLGPVYEAGYRVTVGFFLGETYLGHGIAGEAIRKALKIAEESGVKEVCALTERQNERSRRVLKKAGFREEKRIFTRRSGEREKRETIVFTYCL